jgi:hypothetical protein
MTAAHDVSQQVDPVEKSNTSGLDKEQKVAPRENGPENPNSSEQPENPRKLYEEQLPPENDLIS